MNATIEYTFDERIVSDLHKDAYGVRPSSFWWECWNEATDAAKQREWDDLIERLDAELLREKNIKEQAVAEFNVWLKTTMDFAGNEDDALRWMTDGENFEHSQNIECWVYNQGILFTDLGTEIVEKLKRIYGVEY